MSVDERRVKELAYQIWESEGRPHGHDSRHWDQARKLAEAEADTGKKATVPKARKPKAAALTEVSSDTAKKKATAKPKAEKAEKAEKPVAKPKADKPADSAEAKKPSTPRKTSTRKPAAAVDKDNAASSKA
ncbi:DUF2934 domain-containing protein [Pseudomonas sp. Marseille-QA0892]